MSERFITLWRKTGERCLDWDFYVSEDADEVQRVVANVKRQGVVQFSTYRLGERIAEQSDTIPTARP